MFAIKKLSNLLSAHSDDGLLSQPGPEDVPSKDNGVLHKTEGEDGCEGIKAGDPDDDSTAAISESSSFSSHTRNIYGIPTKSASSSTPTDDESRASIVLEVGEECPPLVSSDIGEVKVTVVAIEETVTTVTHTVEETDDEENGMQEVDPSSIPVLEVVAREIAIPGVAICRVSCIEDPDGENNRNTPSIDIKDEATRGEDDAEAGSYGGDVKAKEDSANKAELKASQREIENKAADDVLAIGSKGKSATASLDDETAPDGSSKSEKDGNQTSDTTTNKAGDTDYPLKVETEPRADTKKDEAKQDVVKEGTTTAERKLEEEDQVDGQEGTGFAIEKQSTMVVATAAPKAIATETSVDYTGHFIDTTTASVRKVESEKTNSTKEKSTLPVSKSDTSSLTLAQRMKEMFDSSSPDQASNVFGKSTARSSVAVSMRKVYVDTDPPKTVSLAKDMKAMFDSPPDQPSNAFGKGTTFRSSMSVSEVKENTSNDSPKPFSSAKDMKEIFDSPSSDKTSKAFGIGKETVETEPLKSVSLAKDMKAMFDSPSPDEPSKAFGVGKEDGEVMKPVSLAKDMKAIFDSTSPDAPSKAFGAAPVSLARDMKSMFDSPSPDAPSRAFGVGKGITRKSKGSATANAKPRYDANNVRAEQSDVEEKPIKPNSPVSVVDQMIPLLWTSKKPAKQSPPSPIHPELQVFTEEVIDDKSFDGMEHTVIRDTVIEEESEDIEEITLDDEDGRDDDDIASNCDEDSFVEIIEEVIIDDDCSKDGMSVSIEDELFEVTARVVVDLDLVDSSKKGDVDERSYDEITADDSEYDEKTVDDDDYIVLREDQIEDAESKKRVGEKDKAIIEETAINIQNTDHTDLDSSGNVLTEFLQQRGDDAKQKLVAETTDGAIVEHKDKKNLVTTSAVVLIAPDSKTQIVPSPTIETPKDQNFNPRLLGDRSDIGTLADKLKIFDSPKASSDQAQANVFKQSWRKPKPLIKALPVKPSKRSQKDNECIQKTHVVLPVVEKRETKVDQLNTKPSGTSGYSEEDKALVEEIIRLVKEHGAMLNKHALAERIMSLLAGESKEGTTLSTLKIPLKNTQKNIIQHHSPRNNYAAETSAYSDRRKDDFNDPCLKLMRKDVEVQKDKLNNVDDPDAIPNRNMNRTKRNEQKEDPIKLTFAEKQKEKPEKARSPRMAFDKTRKVLSAEEIIARIWPKTPDGEANPKPFSSSSRASKSASFKSRRKSPSKLGDRLKVFQTPPSSATPSPPTKSPVTFKQVASIESPPKSFADKITNKKMIDIGNETNSNSQQISEKTMKSLLSFQRLWRTRRKMLSSNSSSSSTFNDDASSQKKKKVSFKTMAFSETATISPHGKTANCAAPSEAIKKSSILSIPILYNPANAPAPVSVPGSNKSAATSPRSKSDSNECGGGVGVGGCYSLEDLEQGRFDPSIIDMARWEGLLTDESFYEHFGLTKDNFHQQPKWKRDKQKRKIRVAF